MQYPAVPQSVQTGQPSLQAPADSATTTYPIPPSSDPVVQLLESVLDVVEERVGLEGFILTQLETRSQALEPTEINRDPLYEAYVSRFYEAVPGLFPAETADRLLAVFDQPEHQSILRRRAESVVDRLLVEHAYMYPPVQAPTTVVYARRSDRRGGKANAIRKDR